MPDSDAHPTVCPSCGAESHEGARFCPQCGMRLEQTDEHQSTGSTRVLPPDEDLVFSRADRHVFGLAPPGLVLALAVIALFLAVFLLTLGHWIAGGLLLLVAVVFACFFFWTARHTPDHRVAQIAVAMTHAASDRAGFARVSVSSWSRAGWQVLGLRQLQGRLEREQAELIRELGEAVFRDDDERAEALKADARACGERIEQCERDLRLALETARERVGRERDAIRPTQALSREEAEMFGAAQADQ